MIQLGKEMDNKILDNLALRVNEYFLKMLCLYFVRRFNGLMAMNEFLAAYQTRVTWTKTNGIEITFFSNRFKFNWLLIGPNARILA